LYGGGAGGNGGTTTASGAQGILVFTYNAVSASTNFLFMFF
jgi:hypothetical protein